MGGGGWEGKVSTNGALSSSVSAELLWQREAKAAEGWGTAGKHLGRGIRRSGFSPSSVSNL